MQQINPSVLVLDFGGVITRTLFETHALSEEALGLTPGSLTWRGPFDPASDPLWQEMQAERISERDYWLARSREVGALLGRNWQSMADLVRAARGADPEAVIRPEARAAIARAKAAGCRLAILSNELDLFYGSDFRARLPLLASFDVIVDASYDPPLKPDPEAYAKVCRALDCAAGDCVFVDDQPKNIRGGVAAGMDCVWFDVQQPAASFQQALQRLGLDPSGV